MKGKAESNAATFSDRIAMLFGCGILGAFTGVMFGIPVFVLLALTSGAFSFQQAPFHVSFVWFPTAFGSVAAIGGALWPDQTAELIAKAWRGIVNMWRVISSA